MLSLCLLSLLAAGGLAQSKFSTGGLFGPSPAASQGGGLFPQQNPGAAVFKSPAAIGVSAATGTGLGGLSAGGLFGAGGGMGAGLGTNTQGTPLRFEVRMTHFPHASSCN